MNFCKISSPPPHPPRTYADGQITKRKVCCVVYRFSLFVVADYEFEVVF